MPGAWPADPCSQRSGQRSALPAPRPRGAAYTTIARLAATLESTGGTCTLGSRAGSPAAYGRPGSLDSGQRPPVAGRNVMPVKQASYSCFAAAPVTVGDVPLSISWLARPSSTVC